MSATTTPWTLPGQLLLEIRNEPAGRFTALVPGIPQLCAGADTHEAAIEGIRGAIIEWFITGRLVMIPLPAMPMPRHGPGWPDNDPIEQEFLQELQRMKREDLERTLREYEQEDAACSNA
jgi:hypothetical protein